MTYVPQIVKLHPVVNQNRAQKLSEVRSVTIITRKGREFIKLLYVFEARSIPVQETRDGKLQLPKTYITKKGAIVLFAAPDNPTDVQPSERDRLFQKRVRFFI